MSRSLVTVSGDEPIAVVADLLSGFEISGLPVVDDKDRLVGVISQTDLVRFLGSAIPSSGWRGLIVRDLMTSPAKTVSGAAPMEEAARLMTSGHVHRLVVVDDRQSPIGVISEGDIVHEMADYCDER